MPELRITLVGPLDIRARDVVLDGARLGRHGEVAFARLVLDRRIVARDALADAIWGDHLPPSWQAALRNVVARIRAELAAAGLAESIGLAAPGGGYRRSLTADVSVAQLDLERDSAAAAHGPVDADGEEAARLIRRALTLPTGGVVPRAHGEWFESYRRRVAERRLALLRAGVQLALARGDPQAAESIARNLVAEAPLHEEGHRLLMRALAAADNRAAALAAYEGCRRLLADELGTVPSDATQQVFLEILRSEGEETAPSGGRRLTAASGRLLIVQRQTPFVGRGELFRELVEELARSQVGGPHIVAVQGEAGMGKTRLAAELAAHADRAGMTVLYGRADDRIPIAFDAFLEAIAGYVAGFEQSEIAALLGRHGPVLAHLLPLLADAIDPAQPVGIPDVDQQHGAQAVEFALRVASGDAGALLVLDDMQWATRASVAVLEALAASQAPARLLVLVLHRGADDPASLRSLAPEAASRVTCLRLEPLALEDILALTPVAPGNAERRRHAERIWRSSGGNPLLAVELNRDLDADDDVVPSEQLHELVQRRMAALPSGGRDMLRTAAVAGLEFDPEVVSAATATRQAVARDALDSARRASLVQPALQHEGWLAFRHALVQEALIEDLEPGEAMRLHARIGSALESRTLPAEPASLAQLAYHFGAAGPLGEWPRAVRYGLAAARAALEDGVFEDVVATTARALAALDAAGDPDPVARLDLQILLGGAQRALGDATGFATLHAAFDAARSMGDARRMADTALAFSDAGAATDEAYVDASLLETYRAAIEAVGDGDPARRAALVGHLAVGSAWDLGLRAARPAVEEALLLAPGIDEPAVRLRVLTCVRRALSESLDLDLQERVEDELFALAERLDDPGARARAALWRFETRLEAGRGHDLEALLDVAERDIRTLRMGSYHHTLAYTRASLALLRGELAEADRLVDAAAALGLRTGLQPAIVDAIRLTQLIGVRREQGRVTELHEACVGFLRGDMGTEWFGVVAFAEGDVDPADDVARDVAGFFRTYDERGPSLKNPIALAAALAPAVASVAPERAPGLYELLLPHRGKGGYFAQFSGPIDWSLGLLARAMGPEVEARGHFLDGAAFARRLGAPRWAARCEREATTTTSGQAPNPG